MVKEGTYISPPGFRPARLIVKGGYFFRVDGTRKRTLINNTSESNINDEGQWRWVSNIKEYIKLL